jgi:cytochrome c6
MRPLLLIALLVALFGTAAFSADLAQDANYKAKCAMCHGANGEGKAAMKTAPLSASKAKTEAELVATITSGKPPKMPAYGEKLKAEEIKALAAEIKALQ